ncbi:MAG: hypothetical protein KIT62_04485 [Cyclobacteriaceae bacterium]|nr:hypothetical protein [Cyclobacteriaceae bacterium]
MKKVFSILFLLLFLFNLVGYYGVYLGLRVSAKQEMRSRLDAEAYNEAETLTIKLPFALPYQNDWDAYKRIDGDFEKDGMFYSLVKHKVERDTLVIVYIRNHQETSLFESFSRFVEATTDTPMSKKAGKLMEHFTKDYLATFNGLETSSTGWILENAYIHHHTASYEFVHTVKSPPPWKA